jgi:hypothetical protein
VAPLEVARNTAQVAPGCQTSWDNAFNAGAEERNGAKLYALANLKNRELRII